MTRIRPTRDQALVLLQEYTENPSLLAHAFAVEAAMRYMARKHGADEDQWGIVGLIHDLDYERYPEAHCQQVKRILDEHGWPEEYSRAALAHGWGICTDVEPVSLLEKTLYAVDELTGFIAACALVRPSRSVGDLQVKSVLKKWKQASFAAGVNRGVIERGAAMLGVPLEELIADVIAALREVHERLGL